MIELTTRFIDDTYVEYFNTGKHELAQIYLKSEADKVIAEMKKACNSKDDWCLHTLKENRHHKYKRCLAMARWCAEMKGKFVKQKWFEKATFWRKWQDKWLELAEKFKPNKSTAQ